MRKIVVMVGLMAVILTACGGVSKEELQRENRTMISMLKENESKIKSLEDTIKAITGGDVKEAISSIGDGSSGKTFNSIGSKIIFKSPLQYPGSKQAPNTAKLNISQSISIVPSSNWLIRVTGNAVEFNHPSGIDGLITIGSIQDIIKVDSLENEVMKGFIGGIPHTSVNYSRLFVENTCYGVQATVDTNINSKPAIFKIGMLGIGDMSMTYIFTYDSDKTKGELVEVLIKTIRINNNQLSVN